MKLLAVLSFLFLAVSSQGENSPDSLPVNSSSTLTISNNKTAESQSLLVPDEERLIEVESESQTENFVLSNSILEVGLEYPMNFGIQLKYMFYDFSYVRFGFGFISGFFLESFEKLSASLGYLNEHESNLLSDAFRNSMYFDLRFGWIPYFKKMGGGPYIELGLSNTLLGKGELEGSHLSRSIPEGSYDELETYSAKTTAFNGTVHIGYSIPFEKIKFNLELGVIKILHTSLMNLSEDQIPIGSQLLSKKQERHFQNFLEERGWIFPTFSGWISLSF